MDTPVSFLINYSGTPTPAELRANKTQIERARAAIKAQMPKFDADLAALDESARSDHASTHRRAHEQSKTREALDFSVRATREIAGRPGLSKWTKGNGSAKQPEPVETDIAAWVDAHVTPDSKVLAIGVRPADRVLRALTAVGARIDRATSGDGTVLPGKTGNPERYRPAQNSLARWLSNTSDAERGSRIFLLGELATENDLTLLTGLLSRDQRILVSVLSPLRGHVHAFWSGPVQETADSVLICSPGIRELDPVQFTVKMMDAVPWPKISVVTVSFNQGRFLESCLHSVLSQGYPNLEYIVVDGGSTDNSQAILQRYKDKLNKLIIEPDEGQSDGLNKGFALATGEILTWINSDDMLAPGALRRTALTFMTHQSDIVAGGCERIGVSDNEVKYRHYAALPFGRRVSLGITPQLRWYDSWDQGDYFFQPEVLFTADIWRRAGSHLKRHLYWGMDWDLWIRMGMAGATVVNIPALIGRSREHPLQKTTTDRLYLNQLKHILMEHDDVLAAAGSALAGQAPD